MKKIIVSILLLFVVVLNCNQAEAKVVTKGNFRFKYKVEKGNVWITKITPLSGKGISTLIIPSKIDGKKVVKLGGSKDRMDSMGDDETNIFGVRYSGEDDGTYDPQVVYNRVKKIKTIQMPSTLKKITYHSFYSVLDGKSINIPKGVTKNVENLTEIKWNKFTVSPKNKVYKAKNGCLLSKDGKELRGFVQKKKKMVVPNGVKTVHAWGDYNGVSTIVFPKSVTDIQLTTEKPVTVKISKKNKTFAVENGCIYNKKTGKLVSGYAKDGVLRIPEKVTTIEGFGFLGPQGNKIVFPAGVKKVYNLLDFSDDDDLICVFKGGNPPELLGHKFGYDTVTLMVPRNSKSQYMKKWKLSEATKVTIVEQ